VLEAQICENTFKNENLLNKTTDSYKSSRWQLKQMSHCTRKTVLKSMQVST